MADILLIHGACHGAWCWHRVLPLLADLGLTARALDLPAHGADPTPAAAATLDGYARAVLDALTGPTLLVGHSAGGYAITAAAEAAAPGQVAGLAYLCAFAPVSGQSLAQMRRAGTRQTLAGTLSLAPDRSSYTFDPAAVDALFYPDCSAEDRALAARSLCAEPVAPQETPLVLTERSQVLPRFYIRCTEDRVILPEFQRSLQETVPPAHRFDLACSHSPFFAAPEATARTIATIHARLPV